MGVHVVTLSHQVAVLMRHGRLTAEHFDGIVRLSSGLATALTRKLVSMQLTGLDLLDRHDVRHSK